eukprot:GDKH01002718.1.p3 GENE.GDKH01002718.1~~GDKH01002718.1.p3  ORF type:complete len:65 (-),score=5.03 GDKH01002718.1:117-284(-)
MYVLSYKKINFNKEPQNLVREARGRDHGWLPGMQGAQQAGEDKQGGLGKVEASRA